MNKFFLIKYRVINSLNFCCTFGAHSTFLRTLIIKIGQDIDYDFYTTYIPARIPWVNIKNTIEFANAAIAYATDAINAPHMQTTLQPNLLTKADTIGPKIQIINYNVPKYQPNSEIGKILIKNIIFCSFIVRIYLYN